MARVKNDSCCSVEELSAHVDGDLPAGRAAEIEAHLGTCQTCCQVRDELIGLTGQLSGLARIAPERDLWPAVARRHREEPVRGAGLRDWLRRFWLLPTAAAVGAAAALLVVVLLGRGWNSGDQAPGAAEPGPVKALQAVLQAEQTYADAVAALQQSMAAGQSDFSPEVQATLDRGLADIDRTLADCRRALRQAPDDLKAHQSMLAAYQHKVDFLTELLGERL